jgi:hypothetical protein
MDRVYFHETLPSTLDVPHTFQPFQGRFSDIISGDTENSLSSIGIYCLAGKNSETEKKES